MDRPKHFKLAASEIKSLVPEAGFCIASDRIVVDGHPVGRMYRESPYRPDDSGWRFYSGDEDYAYIDDPQYFGLYPLNTIANYDPRVIPLLSSPVGSTFATNQRTGRLVRVIERHTPKD